jgi:hypothetical protein
MVGAHRSTTQNPLAAARKSAAWLMALAGLIVVPLGVLGLAIYLAVAYPADAPLFTIAVQGAVCLVVLGNLASGVLRKAGRSPEKRTHLITKAGVLLCLTTVLLADIGRQQRWMHGAYEYAVTAILSLFVVGTTAYWLGAERRLKARDAGRQRPN